MVFRKKKTLLDAEASADLRILSEFYKPSSRRSCSGNLLRGSSCYSRSKDTLWNEQKLVNGNEMSKTEPLSETVVMSLSDLSLARQSEARQYSEQKTSFPRNVLSRLSSKRKRTRRRETQGNKTVLIGNQQREELIMESTPPLVDDVSESSSHNSSVEDELLLYALDEFEYEDESSESEEEEMEHDEIREAIIEANEYMQEVDEDSDIGREYMKTPYTEFQDGDSLNTAEEEGNSLLSRSAISIKTEPPEDELENTCTLLSWMFGCSEADPLFAKAKSNKKKKKKNQLQASQDDMVSNGNPRDIRQDDRAESETREMREEKLQEFGDYDYDEGSEECSAQPRIVYRLIRSN
jgi:hypothetical protein